MSITLGICAGFECAEMAREAGFDFIEGAVGSVLKPAEPEEAFLTAFEEVKNSPLPCRALNCFIPAHLKITGPDVDLAALEAYCATAFERAQRAGISIIVFGSGGARHIPEGWERKRGRLQIVEFLRRIAPEAARRGVTVVIEPLRSAESNIINTVAEGAAIAREVNAPAIRLLVDAYHWASENEPATDIIEHADLLVHAHIATYPNRLLPGMEPTDFTSFLAALHEANYVGGLSIEAGGDRTLETLCAAKAELKL